MLLSLVLFLLLTEFTFASTASMLSARTLLADAVKYDDQQVDVMGIVESIHKITGPWDFGYYYEIAIYESGIQNMVIIANTPQIPIGLLTGDLIKVKGKFHISGSYATYHYNNYIEAEKIFLLEAA